MKTKNMDKESSGIFEIALKKRFEALTEVTHSEREEDNIVKSILNQAQPRRKKTVIKKNVMAEFFSASFPKLILKPAFSASLVLVAMIAASYYIFFQDPAFEPPAKRTSTETPEKSPKEKTTNNAEEAVVQKEETTKEEIPVYKIKSTKLESLIITSRTRSLDDFFTEENTDSLKLVKAMNSAKLVLSEYGIKIKISNQNKITSEWIFQSENEKYYRQRLQIIKEGTEEIKILFVLQKQQAHISDYKDDKKLDDVTFEEIVQKIKKNYFFSEKVNNK